MIQAENGDCFILEFGNESDPKYILIDGGPRYIYENHLKAELEDIKSKGGKLDLIIVSHVDEDHIYGILDLFVNLRKQLLDDKPRTIQVDAIWHNSFRKTIDPNNYIINELDESSKLSSFGSQTYAISNYACYSLKQGNQLTSIIEKHDVPINPQSSDQSISVETIPKEISNKNVKIRVVGPTKKNIKKLRDEWLKWLKKPKKDKPSDNPYFKAMGDRRYVNLSSIMILAEEENGKRILLTGDGRGDHLIEGLRETGLLDQNDEIHVDVLKLPHHGSEENVSREFFDKIQAKTYIVSANGKNNNPDLSTLKWLVESAKDRGEDINIFVTNETDSTKELVKEYPPTENGYTLEIMEKGVSSAILKIY
ncbi:MAG: ComEC/Rec2 family competence protein [Candidatus Hodarchaeota archaeon]